MSKNKSTPSKTTSTKGLGGATSGMGTNKAAKTVTSAVSKGKAAPSFKPGAVKSTERMKPTTPIIGANRGKGANFATINADRMKNTLKKTGMM